MSELTTSGHRSASGVCRRRDSVSRCAAAFSESNSTLALSRGAQASEPLPALLADQSGRAEGLIGLGLRKNAVPTNATAKPGGEGLLVGKGTSVHWPKFRREQFRVAAPYAEGSKRAGIADDRGAHRVRELIGVLIRKREIVIKRSIIPRRNMRAAT